MGVTGFVGSAVAAELSRRGHEVWGVARQAVASEGLATHVAASQAADLETPGRVEECVAWAQPDAVVNLAAVPDIGPCRDDPAAAWTLNAEAPHALAKICATFRIRLVHVSSDQVFDGSEALWSETDEAVPIHQYGETKRAGERAVLQTHPMAAVVRPALVTGAAPAGRRSSTTFLVDALTRGEAPRMFTDEIRSPIAVGDLARALADLAELTDGGADAAGLFHAGGPEALSRFELALREAAAAGLGTEAIVAVTRAEAGLADERPADLSLDSARLWSRLGWQPGPAVPAAGGGPG
jgi:dTDP-4-dehydrorhamnose reductase